MNMKHEYNFLMYKAADKTVSVNARIKDEAIWFMQKVVADLLSMDKSAINMF